ncbi:MAG: hypothetical protein AABZ47_11845 [Planctomycetota bacterium]
MGFEWDELNHMVGDDLLDPKKHRDVPPLCLKCGYNLTGAISTRCPECGYTINRKRLRQEVIDLKFRAKTLKGIKEWSQAGFAVALLAAILSLVRILLPSTSAGLLLNTIFRFACIVCGLIGVSLGASVLRVLRLPSWLREQESLEPNYLLVIGAICFGGGSIACAIFR